MERNDVFVCVCGARGLQFYNELECLNPKIRNYPSHFPNPNHRFFISIALISIFKVLVQIACFKVWSSSSRYMFQSAGLRFLF
ncbi:hypothetical protein L1987_13810 [Smallanthus sonchifolius]|uniref:Uncharacterized protein n=1 Tax=Smallanthus sonchifolius TaxID=185202 RepID=A0ACB9JJQ6_9ASTR|nr:hypothetical protein L1987_13810 [Smallanthus sonchifolius]